MLYRDIKHPTKEADMKTLQLTLATLSATVSPALATPAASSSDSGLMTWLFIGFFALIVVAQLVPGLLLVGSVIKGLLSSAAGSSAR